jgi:large subunit ribosomal protein L30e
MIDFSKQIAITLKTGKTDLGSRSASAAAKLGRVGLIILASNCPDKEQIVKDAQNSGVPTYIYKGTSMELGTLCGKPFIVAAITVRETGDSEILRLAEKDDAVTKD